MVHMVSDEGARQALTDGAGGPAGGGTSKQAQRHRRIIDAVMEAGSVSIEDLASLVEVSVMTIHRDLTALEAKRVLRKQRGMATALPTSAMESNDAYRRGQQRREKTELAAAAMTFIQPGQTVMLDDSTTLLPLLDLLPERAPLTVASNSLSVINHLVGTEGIDVVGIGGEYHRWCNAFMGQSTNDAIAALQVDLAVMSTSAVTDGGCYHQRQNTVATKRALMRAATTTVLLVDHSKFERRAMFRMCALADFDHVVVDSGTSRDQVRAVKELGVDVTVAPRT